MWLTKENAARVDEAVKRLLEGLGSSKSSRQRQSAIDFVTEFQVTPDPNRPGEVVNRGHDQGFYRGVTPADSYLDVWDRGYGWFPERWGELNDFEPARVALYELVVRVPVFLFGRRPPLQSEIDRAELLRHCVNYLQARRQMLPPKFLALAADSFPDSLKNSIKQPRNALAQRVLAAHKRPEYSHMSEMELVEELAQDGENAESAKTAIRRFYERLARRLASSDTF